MLPIGRRGERIPVRVGEVQIGGDAPVVVQAMTNTDTEDAEATAEQVLDLCAAGAEMVRFTVNSPRAAVTVAEIESRVRDAGCSVPLIGDFHYNGHRLLKECRDCAQALDKYRINPGNVGRGERGTEYFSTICAIARDRDKAIRIGVNAGSINGDLLAERLAENEAGGGEREPHQVRNACMVESALISLEAALACGLPEERIVLSCKASAPTDLIEVNRMLSEKTRQPLHLGLTEAGPGMKGLVWSAASMGVLLGEGIGDTIRVSLTPEPGGSRCDEVYAAQELLQSLGLRRFAPTVTACPGCGRTSSSAFQALAKQTKEYIRDRLPAWRSAVEGVEALEVGVMGCVVNGPGESKAADIGISLPGKGEAPTCVVYINGEKETTISGTLDVVAAEFLALLEQYVTTRYAA